MIVTRRNFAIGAAAVASASIAKSQSLVPTSGQEMGPFYPMVRPADHDADLTRVKGRRGTAAGQPINVIGRIVDPRGNPVRNAQVELWQCNAAGRYDHPGDRANPAALDPNFQGFAKLVTDRNGEFKFRSVKPKDYDTPVGRRTPHIHFDLASAKDRLVTQMYFPGESLNEVDFLLRDTDNKQTLIAEAIDRLSGDPQALAFRWNVVLGLS